ncbi:MAG: fibronectin type III domain-containing protein [Candidatus Sericytochromatia bacterium]
MRKPRYHLPLLTAMCAFSLKACGPVPTYSQPSSQPDLTVSPSDRPVQSNQTPRDLVIHLQADAALQAFVTSQATPFTLCLGQISRASTTVNFNGALTETVRAGLQAAGISVTTVKAQTLLSLNSDLTLSSLLAGAAPGAPLNPQLVEQTSSSLTLQWDFPTDARSFTLYLDGVPLQEGYVSPNYYRFEGLTADTRYRLGVQSVSPGGTSEIVAVTSMTTDNGRSASGNFSGGGGGGSHSSPPDPGPSIIPSPVDFGEFLVNTYTNDGQALPAVAMDSAGDYVIAWQSYSQEGPNYGVYARHFTSNGIEVGSEFKVNTYSSSSQLSPAVAIDSDGDFVITWMGKGQDGSDYGIFAQRYTSAGLAQGTEFKVNTYTSNGQKFSSVAMDAAGNFVINWDSSSQDGNSLGIYAQRYNAAGEPQ